MDEKRKEGGKNIKKKKKIGIGFAVEESSAGRLMDKVYPCQTPYEPYKPRDPVRKKKKRMREKC